MKNGVFLLIVGSLSLLLGFGCSSRKEASQDPADYPASLAAVDGASGVSYDKNRGADQVRYTVKTDYPAEAFVEALNRRLSREGWRPLKTDFLNPGLPTAHTIGWAVMTDRNVRPIARIHLWNGEWQNQGGETLVYVLSYRYPESGPTNYSVMDVMGLHIPPEAAEKARAYTNQFR